MKETIDCIVCSNTAPTGFPEKNQILDAAQTSSIIINYMGIYIL